MWRIWSASSPVGCSNQTRTRPMKGDNENASGDNTPGIQTRTWIGRYPALARGYSHRSRCREFVALLLSRNTSEYHPGHSPPVQLRAARAPALPHATVGALDASGKAFNVHQGGRLHPPAQGGAEVDQARQITSQIDGDPHEVLRRTSDQFRKAQVGQLGQPRAPNHCLAHQRNHGDTHPEGVEASGVPVVGKGIQHDIDVMVPYEVSLPRLMPDEGHALGRDAVLR